MEQGQADVVLFGLGDLQAAYPPSPSRAQWQCGISTPLLGPVVPEVYMMQKMSSDRGAGPSHGAQALLSVQATCRQRSGKVAGASPTTTRVGRWDSSSARLAMCSTSAESTTTVDSWESFNWWRRNAERSSVLSITAVARR